MTRPTDDDFFNVLSLYREIAHILAARLLETSQNWSCEVAEELVEVLCNDGAKLWGEADALEKVRRWCQQKLDEAAVQEGENLLDVLDLDDLGSGEESG